jgi:hypothetical protein
MCGSELLGAVAKQPWTTARRSAEWRQATDTATQNEKEQAMFNTGYNGIIGLLILVGDIWALINIFQSSASNEKKLLWALVVILLPLLGLILWYFLGPRDGRT